MNKNKGFVLMETIIIVSILSVSLLLLYSSYANLIRQSRKQVTYDTTEIIYKTYLLKDFIDLKIVYDEFTENDFYFAANCNTIGLSLSCDLSSDSYDGVFVDFKKNFEIEKMYIINPVDLNTRDKTWLMQFDAHTIDYLNSLGTQTEYLIVVKYNKQFLYDNPTIYFGSTTFGGFING